MNARTFTEEEVRELLKVAVKKAQEEVINAAIKINADGYSRGSVRVALHNLRVRVTGEGEKA